VTAAFNKNLLVRLDRKLGADFDLVAFDHCAVLNARHSRVEMHLVRRTPERVLIPGADLTVAFDAGESIWTERSNTHTPAGHRAATRPRLPQVCEEPASAHREMCGRCLPAS